MGLIVNGGCFLPELLLINLIYYSTFDGINRNFVMVYSKSDFKVSVYFLLFKNHKTIAFNSEIENRYKNRDYDYFSFSKSRLRLQFRLPIEKVIEQVTDLKKQNSKNFIL